MKKKSTRKSPKEAVKKAPKKMIKKSKKSASKKPSRIFRKIKVNVARRGRKTKKRAARAGALFSQNTSIQTPAAQNTYHSVEVRSNTPFSPELPLTYGEDRAVLLVRDPWWIFAYWEVTERRRQQVAGAMRREGLNADKMVLRVYDSTDGPPVYSTSFFDIEINGFASNWYIDVGRPDRQWVVEVGFRAWNGKFFVLVRSNLVRTPRFGPSDVLDEEWMMPDELYWKLFGMSSGLGRQKSSLDVKEMLERFLRNIISSERSSGVSRASSDTRLQSSIKE